jgi:hypothetical protein
MKTLLSALVILFATAGLAGASTAPRQDATGFEILKAKDAHDSYQQEARRKKRIPGGSGCDDPGDYAEHPECRG